MSAFVLPLVALPARFSTTADTWRVSAYSTGAPYCAAITRAGGIPVLLPPEEVVSASARELMGRFDALVLPGGPDIDPQRYGATERHETLYGLDDRHDSLDLALAAAAVDVGLPVLAICRGMQVLNVALGGSLHQHITDSETSVQHRFQLHLVRLAEGCRAALAAGSTEPVGHSVHHQALDRLGEGLVVTGRAPDGIVEAVELSDSNRWVVGVQWHPEDTASDDVEQQGLFDELVRQAAARSERRS